MSDFKTSFSEYFFSKVVHCLLFGLFCLLGFHFGEHLSKDELLNYFKNLKDQGFYLYAIFGVWIAIVYPEVILVIKEGKSRNVSKSFYSVLFPLIVGTISICFGLIIDFSIPIIKIISSNHFWLKPYFQKIGLTMILFGYFEQIFSFLMALVPLYQLKFKVAELEARRSISRNDDLLVTIEEETDDSD